MNAMTNIDRPCTISESIKKSCQEVNARRKDSKAQLARISTTGKK